MGVGDVYWVTMKLPPMVLWGHMDDRLDPIPVFEVPGTE